MLRWSRRSRIVRSLPTNAHARAVAKQCEALLSSRQDERKVEGAQLVSDSCIGRQGVEVQNALANSGCIELLVQFSTTPNPTHKTFAFLALAQICFTNTQVSTIVCDTDQFFPTLLAALNNAHADSRVVEALLRTATNAAGNCWSRHAQFLPLVPTVLRVLQDPSQTALTRAECVGFINVLAYNEATRHPLVQYGVVPPLVEVMKSGNMQLEDTTAAVAVANLVGGCEDQFVMPAEFRESLMQRLVACFASTLAGRDFPLGSGLFFSPWKLAIGMANLCCNARNRAVLREAGLADLLRDSLRTVVNTSSREAELLARYSLMALWELSKDDQP